MTRVASSSVVNVVAHAAVVRVSIRFVVRVTGVAGERCEIGGISVAVGTSGPLALVMAGVDREPGVSERGTRPCSRVVTCLAGSGE
jgi:hypothetical protein